MSFMTSAFNVDQYITDSIRSGAKIVKNHIEVEKRQAGYYYYEMRHAKGMPGSSLDYRKHGNLKFLRDVGQPLSYTRKYGNARSNGRPDSQTQQDNQTVASLRNWRETRR